MAPTKARPVIRITEEMVTGRDWHRRQVPKFKVEECAKVFFGMSASWLRRLMRPGKDGDHPLTWFVWDGKPMEFRRLDPARPDSARVFLLSDIEKMAYSLLEFGVIDNARLARVLDVVLAEARLFGLFNDPDYEADDPGDPAASA